MNDAGLVGAVTHLTSLGIFHRGRNVGGNRTHFRVWHQATRPEDLPQLADDAHRIRGRNHNIKISSSALNLFSEIVKSDFVSASLGSCVGIGALSKHRNAHILASAVWQYGGATHNLIGFARVNTEIDRHINRFFELGCRQLFRQVKRVENRIELVTIELVTVALFLSWSASP